MRAALQGKKTYIVCGVTMLHALLGWCWLLPSQASWDIGSTGSEFELFAALLFLTMRCACARMHAQLTALRQDITRLVQAWDTAEKEAR